MQANNPDFASGASAARNQVANALAEMGIDVLCNGGPPLDDDFKDAIRSWKLGLAPVSGTTVLAFHWHQATYEVAVPFTVLVGIA